MPKESSKTKKAKEPTRFNDMAVHYSYVTGSKCFCGEEVTGTDPLPAHNCIQTLDERVAKLEAFAKGACQCGSGLPCDLHKVWAPKDAPVNTKAAPDDRRCWCQHFESNHIKSGAGTNLCRYCDCQGFSVVAK